MKIIDQMFSYQSIILLSHTPLHTCYTLHKHATDTQHTTASATHHYYTTLHYTLHYTTLLMLLLHHYTTLYHTKPLHTTTTLYAIPRHTASHHYALPLHHYTTLTIPYHITLHSLHSLHYTHHTIPHYTTYHTTHYTLHTTPHYYYYTALHHTTTPHYTTRLLHYTTPHYTNNTFTKIFDHYVGTQWIAYGNKGCARSSLLVDVAHCFSDVIRVCATVPLGSLWAPWCYGVGTFGFWVSFYTLGVVKSEISDHCDLCWTFFFVFVLLTARGVPPAPLLFITTMLTFPWPSVLLMALMTCLT